MTLVWEPFLSGGGGTPRTGRALDPPYDAFPISCSERVDKCDQVIIFTPGEMDADPYWRYITEETITGVYAKEVGGAVILMERKFFTEPATDSYLTPPLDRYFGESSPYENQTTKNLQYLNVEQAVADFVHFARSVELPFDGSGRTNAPQAVGDRTSPPLA